MVAFSNTILYDNETEIWTTPNITNAIKLFTTHIMKRDTYYYVTKRSYDWWSEKHIRYLSDIVPKEEIYLIYIVRDPRDVLTSKHGLSERKYYVEPSRWLASINAGEILIKKLENYKNMLVLRYEDIVNYSYETRKIIENKFSLHLNTEVEDWSKLKENLQNIAIENNMIAYMHKLRNFDPSSIGKWRNDPEKMEYIGQLIEDKKYGLEIRRMAEKYGYHI
jgi:hypothetical protein